MPDREAEPGVWGSCKCGRFSWTEGLWCDKETLPVCVLSGFCGTCGDELLEGGHVTNLRREVERMLAESIASLKDLPPDDSDWAYWWSQVQTFRKVLATNCLHCKGTGYVTQEGAPDFDGDTRAVTQAMVPCPDCQPDAKENDDED